MLASTLVCAQTVAGVYPHWEEGVDGVWQVYILTGRKVWMVCGRCISSMGGRCGWCVAGVYPHWEEGVGGVRHVCVRERCEEGGRVGRVVDSRM